MFMHGQTSPPAALSKPWRLPPSGMAVFHGERHAPRLSHYFLPRLALEGKRILFLDGANCADPRLMARLAERRGIPFAQFNQQIMMARAFTCFQLTELISRVPQFLAEFPAQILMVTAFPELYFDEDVRQADATAAFQQALGHLRRFSLPIDDCRLTIDPIDNRQSKIGNCQSLAPSSQHLAVALFSSASGFQPPAGRKLFFAQTCAVAAEIWKFQVDGQGRLGLTQQDKVLGAGDWVLGKNPSPQHPSGVARTPVFGVRGSSLANAGNLQDGRLPQVWEREEEPQTSKAEVCATRARSRVSSFDFRVSAFPQHPIPST